MSEVVDFILGKGVDNKGRYLSDILNFNSVELELCHDYIQWLFPLKKSSKYNSHAPLLTKEDIRLIKKYGIENILKSFEKMLDFYGYELIKSELGMSVRVKKHCYLKRFRWLNTGNHNYKRISRILESLMIFGLGDYAECFYNALEVDYLRHRIRIGISYKYWKKIMEVGR